MRILLIGKGGQVGFELRRALAPLGEVVAVDYPDCDLADPASIRRTVEEARPGVVVNAAAYTAVDKAESETERARAINAVAPGAQGQGYGWRAWQAMLAQAHLEGAERVRTAIVARNHRVLNLYARLGFRFPAPLMTFHWVHPE